MAASHCALPQTGLFYLISGLFFLTTTGRQVAVLFLSGEDN
jgi:hypothetical protein